MWCGRGYVAWWTNTILAVEREPKGIGMPETEVL